MVQLKLITNELRKLEDPVNNKSKRFKYMCYVLAKSIPKEIDEWMATNPREQKMTTNVAVAIKDGLNDNPRFHELNRGILISASKVDWDNVTKELTITLEDPEIHGNIDGGHTLRAILEAQNKNILSSDRYVFFEILTGLDSPVELAAARNTSVQVDLKSIAELEKSFETIKEVFEGISFSSRIQYKMNEHYNDSSIDTPIDVREIISILIMFSQEIYPFWTATGGLSDVQPTQCYSGKEASLRKFLYSNSKEPKRQKTNRETMLRNMQPIIKDIFSLWEKIETSFTEESSAAGKRYGSRKYSKYNDGKVVGKSFFEQQDLRYIVPKGLLYPLVGAFRALVQINNDGTYYWKKPPLEVWESIGHKLVSMILDEKSDSTDFIAKNTNLWSNLFKEVYIFAYMQNNPLS